MSPYSDLIYPFHSLLLLYNGGNVNQTLITFLFLEIPQNGHMVTVSFASRPSLRFPLLVIHWSNLLFRERGRYLCLCCIRGTATAKKISPEIMPIVAEYAKSNRSSCKSCSKAIASKTLRVGLVSKGPGGFDMTRWHHLDCFPTDSESIASVDDIKGLSALEVRVSQRIAYIWVI